MRLERYGFRFFLSFAALPAAGRRAMTAADERGDAPGRSEMSRQWRPVLLAYFLRRVNDHAEAEDLTQEMLVRLLGMDVEELEQPEAYIFRIASNLLADRSEEHTSRLNSSH